MGPITSILSILLATTYAVTGSAKLAAPRERLLAVRGMGWVATTPMPRVRVLGFLEIAGAIALLLPFVTGIVTPLTPLAAWGLAAVQVGAIWTHVSHGERASLWVNVLLLAAAVVVALQPAVR
jgi:hypothetical protein